MNKGAFVNRVQEICNLPSKAMAERGVQIVFSLLSHRLTQQERQDVASQLPRDLQGVWNSDTWIVNFLEISRQFQLKYRHKEELYSLIQEELRKLQIPIGAEKLTLAVFHVLKEQITQGEIDDISGQLPKEIEQLWTNA